MSVVRRPDRPTGRSRSRAVAAATGVLTIAMAAPLLLGASSAEAMPKPAHPAASTSAPVGVDLDLGRLGGVKVDLGQHPAASTATARGGVGVAVGRGGVDVTAGGAKVGVRLPSQPVLPSRGATHRPTTGPSSAPPTASEHSSGAGPNDESTHVQRPAPSTSARPSGSATATGGLGVAGAQTSRPESDAVGAQVNATKPAASSATDRPATKSRHASAPAAARTLLLGGLTAVDNSPAVFIGLILLCAIGVGIVVRFAGRR